MMRMRRFQIHGPDDEPVWRTIHVRPIDNRWVAMILDNDAQAPGPDELRGIALFAATPEAAEAMALNHLGLDPERTQHPTSPLSAGPPRQLSQPEPPTWPPPSTS